MRYSPVFRSVGVALAASLVLSSSPTIAGAGDPGAPAAGALSVKSNPSGAAVYVDGEYTGQTPMSSDRLPPGDHRVRLVKDGYLENSRVVSINAGRPTEVQVTLTRQVAAATAPAGQVVRSPTRPGATAESGRGGISAKSFLIGAAAGAGGAGLAWRLFLNNKRPTAGAIAVSPTGTGMAGSTAFQFTAQGADDRNGDSLTYAWNFGDGATATGQTTSHTYAGAGSYTATLTVSDGNSSASPPGVVITVGSSMAGTWVGAAEPGFGASMAVTPTQSGGTLGGSVTFGAPISTTANINTGGVTPLTYPTAVTFTTAAFTVSLFPGLTFTVRFDGMTNAAGTTMTGTVRTTSSNPTTFPEQVWTQTISR